MADTEVREVQPLDDGGMVGTLRAFSGPWYRDGDLPTDQMERLATSLNNPSALGQLVAMLPRGDVGEFALYLLGHSAMREMHEQALTLPHKERLANALKLAEWLEGEAVAGVRRFRLVGDLIHNQIVSVRDNREEIVMPLEQGLNLQGKLKRVFDKTIVMAMFASGLIWLIRRFQPSLPEMELHDIRKIVEDSGFNDGEGFPGKSSDWRKPTTRGDG